MTDQNKETAFLSNVRQTLDSSLDGIDSVTESRLRQIRYQALQQKKNRPAWLMPFSTFAATASVLVLSITLWFTHSDDVNREIVIEDIPLLTASEELDFYQDIEFYNWLDNEQING